MPNRHPAVDFETVKTDLSRTAGCASTEMLRSGLSASDRGFCAFLRPFAPGTEEWTNGKICGSTDIFEKSTCNFARYALQ